MSPEEARKLADEYEERQIKYEKKLFTRLKNYFKNKKKEKEIKRRLKHDYLNRIHYAALYGEYDIVIKEYFNECDEIDLICRKKLKEDGYNITHEVQDWGTAYTISWEEKKNDNK